MYRLKKRTAIFTSLLFIFIVTMLPKVYSYSNKADEYYIEGIKLMQRGEWRDAGEKFRKSAFFAENYVQRGNATKKAAEAYYKGRLYYQEFKCLKAMVNNYTSMCNVDKAIEREYQIGNAYYDGYRETPYPWLPWIKDGDKAIEIYETILQQAPYAPFIPDMMEKMGIIYLKSNQNNKAIEIYKRLLERYPDTYAAKMAYLDLANIYIQYAESADGDGDNAKKAIELLLTFKRKYPKAKEMEWVDVNLRKAKNLAAKRLYNIAEFYYNNNNSRAAKRYLNEIIVNYPESKYFNKAEKLLEEIELPLYPPKLKKAKKRKSKYKIYNLPKTKNENKILVIPENSGGKWLRPIRDLGIREEKALQNKYSNNL